MLQLGQFAAFDGPLVLASVGLNGLVDEAETGPLVTDAFDNRYKPKHEFCGQTNIFIHSARFCRALAADSRSGLLGLDLITTMTRTRMDLYDDSYSTTLS